MGRPRRHHAMFARRCERAGRNLSNRRPDPALPMGRTIGRARARHTEAATTEGGSHEPQDSTPRWRCCRPGGRRHPDRADHRPRPIRRRPTCGDDAGDDRRPDGAGRSGRARRRPTPRTWPRGSPRCCSRSSTPARSPRPRWTPSITALQDAGPVLGRPRSRGAPRRSGPRSAPGSRWRPRPTTIGISEDDLRAALQDGQTLAEVATANGVEPQAVIDALVRGGHDRAWTKPSRTAASSRPTPTNASPT